MTCHLLPFLLLVFLKGATTGSSRDEDDLTSVTLPDETGFDFDDDDDDDVKGKAKGRGGKEEEVGQKALWVVARTAKRSVPFSHLRPQHVAIGECENEDEAELTVGFNSI
jgi:hypothetical protein